MPRPRSILISRDRVALWLALVTFLVFASGGAGLAHRVLAHADGNHAPTGDAHADAKAHTHGGSHCGATLAAANDQRDVPREEPRDHDSDGHNCDLCLQLVSGATPPAAPDVVSPPRPTAFTLLFYPACAQQAAPVPLPPARGPPSVNA